MFARNVAFSLKPNSVPGFTQKFKSTVLPILQEQPGFRMKSLRMIVLMLAVAAVPFSAKPAFSQQEIDPDHFDGPVAAKPAAKAPARKVTAHYQAEGKANPASKHAKQHHSHATAPTA